MIDNEKCHYCKYSGAPPSQSVCWGCDDNNLYEPRFEYNEIKELFEYCQKIGVNATLEPLYDGFAIRFFGNGDFVQHRYSYGGGRGYVEPNIGCKDDYTPILLKTAKALVRRNKKCLNKKRSSQ